MKTISVHLPDETESLLRSQALERGVSLESYLLQLGEREAASTASCAKGLAEGIAWLTGRTLEDVAAARVRLLGTPVRPLPPGKSLVEAVEGTWPGHETDAQINDALERLS